MSEYTVVDCEYTDADSIKAALEELGYPCTVHKTAQNLRGYQGDRRSQKAHIIIDRKDVGSAANDVGFHRRSDGSYELIISEFDRHQKQGKVLMEDLKQIYAKHKTVKQARKMGYTVKHQSVDEQGNIKIKVQARY